MKTSDPEPLTMSALESPAVPREAASPVPGLRFISVATQNVSRQDVLSYNPFTEPIVLVMEYEQSSQIQSAPKLAITGTWQIIEGKSNQVVADFRFESQTPLRAPFISWALNAGTAHDRGLSWFSDDLYGFRAFIEATFEQNGGLNVDSYDVSVVKWFRLQPVFEV